MHGNVDVFAGFNSANLTSSGPLCGFGDFDEERVVAPRVVTLNIFTTMTDCAV